MICNSKPTDRAALQHLTQAIGFEDAETAEILSSFDAAHQPANRNGAMCFIDDDGGLQGVAYVEPERMTHGTYNLLLVAVHPHVQKQGRGTKLIRHVEDQVAEHGGRVLIIETMGTEDFAHVRRLYKRLGFVEEARIRDFYAEGYDKVVFWKSMTSLNG